MPSPANIVIMAAGLFMLIASFFSFYEFSVLGASGEFTAWSSRLFFPVSIIPVVFGVVMAAQVAISTFAPQVKMPDKLFGFDWNQVHVALGAQAAIMMLAFFMQDRAPLDIGAGFWLMLLASIGLVVGAVMKTREPAPTASDPD
jgi:hypothetical protein